MRRTFICAALAVAAAALAAPAGAATGTLDQQQPDTDGGYYSATGPDVPRFLTASVAQTFTAGMTGKLDGIAVFLDRISDTDDPLTIEIRDTTADGKPGSSVLTQATVTASGVPGPGDFPDWVAVDFSVPADLTSGTRYSIVGHTSGLGQYRFLLGLDVYAGGMAWSEFDGPPDAWEMTSLDGVTSYDMTFKTYVVANYSFGGFASPIDTGMVNTAKAGATIPVRWHLENHDGTPISDPASFSGVTSKAGSGACAGLPSDAVEDYSGGSGLQYLGDGDWQFNWKAPKSYAGQCRTLVLTLSDGSTYTASFQFK